MRIKKFVDVVCTFVHIVAIRDLTKNIFAGRVQRHIAAHHHALGVPIGQGIVFMHPSQQTMAKFVKNQRLLLKLVVPTLQIGIDSDSPLSAVTVK